MVPIGLQNHRVKGGSRGRGHADLVRPARHPWSRNVYKSSRRMEEFYVDTITVLLHTNY